LGAKTKVESSTSFTSIHGVQLSERFLAGLGIVCDNHVYPAYTCSQC